GFGEDLAVLSLAPLHHWRGDHQPGLLGERQHLVGDLLDRLPADLATAVRTVGVTNARVQQAKVVVDLGDRAHRRPRVATGPLLIDADGRAQTLDVVDVR